MCTTRQGLLLLLPLLLNFAHCRVHCPLALRLQQKDSCSISDRNECMPCMSHYCFFKLIFIMRLMRQAGNALFYFFFAQMTFKSQQYSLHIHMYSYILYSVV